MESVFTPFETPSLPEIPNRVFAISEHGAVAGGKTLNTGAIAAAIGAAHAAGGGRVVVPAGIWLSGPIHLQSRTELHLEEGAELKFSQNPDDYLPVVLIQRGGVWCYNYSPFIYARDAHDVTVTGSGTLNGQGERWWPWKKNQPGMKDLFQANAERRPVEQRVYGTREAGVRPPMLQFINSESVLLEGVTFRDSPSWTVHPVCCENVTIREVTVDNQLGSANTDGINIDSCRCALLEECHVVQGGDNAICLKAGRQPDALVRGRTCEDVIIRNCRIGRAGGIALGGECSAGIRNAWIHDCVFEDSNLAIRIKPRFGQGGFIRNILWERLTMRNIRKCAINATSRYAEPHERNDNDRQTPEWTDLRDITIRDIRCDGAAVAAELIGLPDAPLRNINLENIKIRAADGITLENIENLNMTKVLISETAGESMPLNLLDRKDGETQ